jgi:phage shock protein A
MGIFSRTRDIIAANVTDLLDKSQDPAKMIRMIILEMEETLVEVRASAARTIADQKELRRHIDKLNTLETDWTDKAHLALSKDREDLAKAALLEKRKATDMKEQLTAEVDVLNDALKASEQDIHKLQKKLADARSRQNAHAWKAPKIRSSYAPCIMATRSVRHFRVLMSSNAALMRRKDMPTPCLSGPKRRALWATKSQRLRASMSSTPNWKK